MCIISALLSGYRVEHKRYWNRPVTYPICQSVCVCLVSWSVHKVAEWLRVDLDAICGGEMGRSRDGGIR